MDGLSLFAQLYHAPGRAGRRETLAWTAVLEGIDTFRSEQRFCPSEASLEANDSSGSARRRAARRDRQITCGAQPANARHRYRPRSLSEKGSLAGQTAPRVGFTFRTRETGLWRSNAEPTLKVLEERLAGCKRISKGESMSEEARTRQEPQTSTTKPSEHSLSSKENKRVQAGQSG